MSQLKPQIGNETDVMPGSDGLRIWGFEKEQLVEIWTWTGQVDFRSSPRRDQMGSTGCPHVGWVSDLRADDVRPVSIVRNCLSLPMSENLKLKKVNKSFVPDLKKVVKCFVFFGFLCTRVWTLWTFYACEYLGRIFGPICNIMTKLSWNKDPKRYFPRRCSITLTIHNWNDAT